MNGFRFKQFFVRHDRCAMKVGTDGVLLGSWATVSHASTALDIGTGTGLIALMLAQRNPNLLIDALDIDPDAVAQAQENIAASPFHDRIKVHLQDFTLTSPISTSSCSKAVANSSLFTLHSSLKSPYSLIISNPPFYTEHTSCPDDKRDAARHTSSLPISSLMSGAASLLAPEGLFSLIIPTSLVPEVISEGAQHGLFLSRRTDVVTTPNKQPKRTLLEFSKHQKETHHDILHIRDAHNNYTEAYKNLTQDFYL